MRIIVEWYTRAQIDGLIYNKKHIIGLPMNRIDVNAGILLTTVFTRLSAAALFKFSELQMRRSFGGRQSGAAL